MGHYSCGPGKRSWRSSRMRSGSSGRRSIPRHCRVGCPAWSRWSLGWVCLVGRIKVYWSRRCPRLNLIAGPSAHQLAPRTKDLYLFGTTLWDGCRPSFDLEAWSRLFNVSLCRSFVAPQRGSCSRLAPSQQRSHLPNCLLICRIKLPGWTHQLLGWRLLCLWAFCSAISFW